MKEADLVLFIGQSNMAGRGEATTVLDLFAAYEYKAVSAPGQLFDLKEPFGVDENRADGINDVFSGGIKAKTGSMVTSFCNAYFRLTGTPVVGVSASKGGSSIEEWQPEAGTGYLKDAVNRYCEAKKYLEENNIKINRTFALWCQGETDGDLKTSKRDYVMKFNSFWKELHKFVPDLFLIKTGECNIPGEYKRYDEIRNAQDEIISLHQNVHLASDAFMGMREKGLMKDAFHYLQTGYDLCGKDAGEKVAAFYLKEPEAFAIGHLLRHMKTL